MRSGANWLVGGRHIHLVHRIDDAARVFEAAQQRMDCVG